MIGRALFLIFVEWEEKWKLNLLGVKTFKCGCSLVPVKSSGMWIIWSRSAWFGLVYLLVGSFHNSQNDKPS